MTIYHNEAIREAAQLIASADALLIGAGAGMGVDSGLPDFRGNEGFWRAYPRFRHLGLSFTDLANPRWFYDDPAQAWGFYGHRYNLYRRTEPHPGFAILRRWSQEKELGGFVFTSNVDGHFQKAGVDEARVIECHGSINHLQCLESCSEEIWPAEIDVDVDEEMLRARGVLPQCPRCGGAARPNILMFGDFGWNPRRCDGQQQRYNLWLRQLRERNAKLVAIELGAGVAVPTVRYECEGRAAQFDDARLVRINPRDRQAPRGSVVIGGTALESLPAIDAVIGGA